MGQNRDYYEDCYDCTALASCCKRPCCEYPPPCCSGCSNCCKELPCVIREDRTIYRRLTPVCAPQRVPCCRIPPRCCDAPCERVCRRPCYECVKCCEPKSACGCVEEEDCCDKYEVIKHLMAGIILLAAFAIFIFSFNQQMPSCKRRPFFF